MTLLDACEPFFHRICQLNQLARTGKPTPDFTSLRRELTNLFNATRDRIVSDPNLERHWSKLETPLIFFLDSMISESALPAAHEWNQKRIAYENKELAGDQKFFELLDQHLADESPDSTARLGVFYTCVGLGFTGWYAGRPDILRAKMAEMLRRLDPGIRTESHLRICPEAYESVDTRELIEPLPVTGTVMALLFGGLFFAFMVVNYFLYQQATVQLRDDIRQISNNAFEHIRNLLDLFL